MDTITLSFSLSFKSGSFGFIFIMLFSMCRLGVYLLSIIGLANAGSVLAQVSIGPTSDGILVESGSRGQRLESSNSGQMTIMVGSDTPNPTIQILAPVFIAGPSPDPSGTSRIATADVAGAIITSAGVSDSTSLSIGTTTVVVDMQVERPSIFPAGSYQYSVDVIVIPN